MKQVKKSQIKRIIVVSHGLRKQTMDALDVTYPTIRNALSYKSNTLKAQLIRLYALEHGGTMMVGSQINSSMLN